MPLLCTCGGKYTEGLDEKRPWNFVCDKCGRTLGGYI